MRTRPASAAGDGLILRFDPRRGRRGLVEDGWTLYEVPGVAVFGPDGSVRFPNGSCAQIDNTAPVQALMRSYPFTVVVRADVTATAGTSQVVWEVLGGGGGQERHYVGYTAIYEQYYGNFDSNARGTNPLSLGKHHLVYVVTNAACACYVDAVANGTPAIPASTKYAVTAIRIASNRTRNANWLGRIYDVRVYNRAWTAAEVLDDYREYT